MAKKANAFLAKIEAERDAAFNAGMRVGIQWNNDIYHLVLRDTDVVGRDTFGGGRLEKIHRAAEALSDELFDALDARLPEADVKRAKMDRGLKEAHGSNFRPFEERYDDLVHCKYEKGGSGK